MTTILMTGVTGTVMNPLCARLLEEGHTVVALVRPAKGISPRERLFSALRVGEEAKERLFVLPGDITQERAGVSTEDQQFWAGKIEKVVHGAASTKFVETLDKQVFLTNVYGTQNILGLAETLGASEFHHMSTVFVGGDTAEFLETDLPDGSGRNAYERSKIEAEALVRNSSLHTSIYRLPIVVGDFLTGEISSFTGYYGCAEPFWRLRQTIPQGKNISLPIHIPCSSIGPLHVVPIDWETKVLGDLLEIPAQGKTFHVVHPNPPKVRDAFLAGLAFLGFEGITCGNESTVPLASTLQKMVERQIQPYGPYISRDEQRFGSEVLQETLNSNGKLYIPPPVLDAPFFERLLSFAIKRNFGRS
jgi:nucleoside-diphosphate-sugar epimerase